jgi:predicted alpha-1,6-mannanase (GH76 family)
MAIGSMCHRVWNVRQAVDEHEVIMTHWNLDIESISWLILVSMSTSLIVQVFFGHWVRMLLTLGRVAALLC